jgi:hypothetical protein
MVPPLLTLLLFTFPRILPVVVATAKSLSIHDGLILFHVAMVI